jgi:threonine/homoserine/homoserine lactone efflux protein
LLFTLCALGVGAIVVAMPALRLALQVAGTAYLVWLAAKLARSSSLTPAQADGLNTTFAQGVALQFLNIKAWMLALTVVAGWLAGRDNFWPRFAMVLPMMLAFGFFSNLLYAALGSLLRDWLSGPVLAGVHTGKRLRGFNRAMAGVLVVTALWMATL